MSSWVIIKRDTNESIFETFSKEIMLKVNRKKYRVVTILEHLQSLNIIRMVSERHLESVKRYLEIGDRYDLNYPIKTNTSNGFKLSIQGKSIEDSYKLYLLLNDYLISNNIPFKVATSKRFAHEHKEQSKKAMTIYIPNGLDVMDVAEKVYELTKDYKGWYDIKTPTSYSHYGGGVFYRNDRDENGNYIKAN